MNTELFKKIENIINTQPESFDVDTWETQGQSGCGTTRCEAGWAIYLTTGQPLKASRDTQGVIRPSQATRDLAVQLGVRADFSLIASKLLGLTPNEGASLFYAPGNVVVRFTRLAAQGKDAEARMVLGQYDDELYS